jgi:hypothetical protein
LKEKRDEEAKKKQKKGIKDIYAPPSGFKIPARLQLNYSKEGNSDGPLYNPWQGVLDFY